MAVPWETIAVLGFLAAVFTGVAAHRLLRERLLRRRGVAARAVVVGHDEQVQAYGSGGGSLQAPIVEFTTRDGRTIRACSPVSSSAPSVAPGRRVTVHYNPKDPSEIAIAGYGRGVPVIFLLIGLALFGLDAVFLFGSEEVVSRLPALIPVVLGCTFAGIGFYGVGRVWSLRLRGGRAGGVVIGETTSSTRDGMPMYHPVVRFRLPGGQEIETASERGRTLRRARHGQAVRVRYDKADPYRMVLAGDGARPVFYIFGFAGLCVLAGTIAVFAMILRS